MTVDPESPFRSALVGDLKLPAGPASAGRPGQVDPLEKVPMLIELNVLYPGGLAVVRQAFYDLWQDYAERAGGYWPPEPAGASPVQPPVPDKLALVAPKLYQCVLSRADAEEMVNADREAARRPGAPPPPGPPAGHLPGLAGLPDPPPDRPFRADRQGRRGLAGLRR